MNNIIKKYIDTLTKEDIYTFIKNNNYVINDNDINTIYFYIKNYSTSLIDNPIYYLNKLKEDISINTYEIILELYNKYKKYI